MDFDNLFLNYFSVILSTTSIDRQRGKIHEYDIGNMPSIYNLKIQQLQAQ